MTEFYKRGCELFVIEIPAKQYFNTSVETAIVLFWDFCPSVVPLCLAELLNQRKNTVLPCCVWRTHASVGHSVSPANLFEVALLVGPLLGVLVVDNVQRRLPLLQLQALDLRLQLVELLLQVLALLHVLHPGGDTSEG